VELLGLAALRGRIVRALALLAIEDRPHRLFAREFERGLGTAVERFDWGALGD
jgi:hypothetical protein